MNLKPRKVTCYESILLVRGRLTSMLDMLRYDSCFPASEAEAGRMERADGAPGLFILRRRAAQPGEPTQARWRSFNCEVLGVFDCVPDAERARDALSG